MIPDIPIPVTLLTGFLGSSEVALDHLLLEETRGPLAQLTRGSFIPGRSQLPLRPNPPCFSTP